MIGFNEINSFNPGMKYTYFSQLHPHTFVPIYNHQEMTHKQLNIYYGDAIIHIK